MDNDTEIIASISNPVAMKQTFYQYTALGNFSNDYFKLIFRKSTDTSNSKPHFWVATHYVDLYTDVCYFRVRYVGNDKTFGYHLYSSSQENLSKSYSFVPMVILQSNIQVTGQNSNNVWLLNVE